MCGAFSPRSHSSQVLAEKTKGRFKRGAKRTPKVVLAAVGKRVIVAGTGSNKGRVSRGVYLEDGKIQLDPPKEMSDLKEDVVEVLSCNAFCAMTGNKVGSTATSPKLQRL